MPKDRQIRIRGVQLENIDVDLLAQIVIMLGRQLAQAANESADKYAAEAKPSEGGDV